MRKAFNPFIFCSFLPVEAQPLHFIKTQRGNICTLLAIKVQFRFVPETAPAAAAFAGRVSRNFLQCFFPGRPLGPPGLSFPLFPPAAPEGRSRPLAEPPMKTIEVVAAMILHEGRILATQRGYGDFKDGWEFPGGKMEPGETAEEAIAREIREELAVEIAPERLVTTVEADYPKFRLIMHCFLCSVVSGDIRLLEHEAARWVTRAELDSVAWLPADIEATKALKAILPDA